MLVVADTSPINYLILIDAIELLPRLYRRVILPYPALDELLDPLAPDPVLLWAKAVPDWIELRSAPETISFEPELDRLGRGERAALLLAESFRAETPLLLLDDQAARETAMARGFATTGTLGILKSADESGWIDLREYFLRLRGTNFRVSDKLLQTLLGGSPLNRGKL